MSNMQVENRYCNHSSWHNCKEQNSAPNKIIQSVAKLTYLYTNIASLQHKNETYVHSTNESKKMDTIEINSLQTNLTKKYFTHWKDLVRNGKEHTQQVIKQMEQSEKLKKFLKVLKKQNTSKIKVNNTNVTQNDKTPVPICQHKISVNNPNLQFIPQSYKHRFQAQNDIISNQKVKLVEQERIISELKLGRLEQDIYKSIKDTKSQMKELYNNNCCSIKVRCQLKPIPAQLEENDLVQFKIKTDKAPKIVQQMEKRALEREERRQVILKRKQIMDEQKKKAIQESIERKQAQDNEERERNLNNIKIQRKKALEIQKQLQMRHQKYLKDIEVADTFRETKLLCFGFRAFAKLLTIAQINECKCIDFHKIYLKRKYFKVWTKFVLDAEILRTQKACAIYEYNLKRRTLIIWKNVSKYTKLK